MAGSQHVNNIWTWEQIHEQEQEIERLLQEQEEHRRNLDAHNRLDHKQQDGKDAQHFQVLLQQRDTLKEELEKEKQSQNELHCEQISSTDLKRTELRNVVSTSKSEKSQSGRTQKVKHIWEDTLNRASTHFSELLTTSNHLRDELKTLNINQDCFHQLYNTLNKELQEVNKKIEEMSNLCHTAYNEKMEVKSEMTMMREKEEKELAQKHTKTRQLDRLKAHQFNLEKFMSIKCHTRSRQDKQLTHRQLSEMREQKKVDSGEELQDALKEMFERIQTVTGEENLDLLDTRFIQVEDRNFALFSFVNEQNNEMEALKDNISQNQEKMEQLRVKDSQLEQDRRYFLREVDEQLKESQSQGEDCENQVSTLRRTLDEIKTEVSITLSKLESDLTVIDDQLGSSAGITDNNLIMYLGVVEQQINELLTIRVFLTSKDLEKDFSLKDLPKFLLGQNPKQIQQRLCVEAAVNSMKFDEKFDENESSVTDEEEWPLSQEELRRRIMKGVLQKDLTKPGELQSFPLSQ